MATTPSSAPAVRRFPRWAIILVGVLGVLLLIALVAPYFLNVDRYRGPIARAIEKQTGRRVTLGPIRARLLPHIGFVIEGFALGNPAGFPEGNLVSTDAIRGSVALRPLLGGVVHVQSIDLVGAKLTLLTDASGKDNYTFPSAPEGDAGSGDEQASSFALGRIDSISLSAAEVTTGTVARGAVTPSVTAKGINLTLRNFALNPVKVRDWEAESNLSGMTVLPGGWSAPIVFDSGQWKLSAGRLNAQFVADLAKAADVKGTASIADVENPQLTFEMSATTLDMDTLMASAGSGPAGASAPRRAPASAPSKELVARGHINIKQIVSKPYTVGPANAELRLYGDRAELWPVTVGMYGGTLQISSRLDRAAQPTRFTANVQMRDLDVAKVLESSPAAAGKMSGKAELDLQLLGSLTGLWQKALSGTGKFAVRDGTLPGVNLGAAAQSLAKFTGVGGDTPFSILEGDLAMASQRISSKRIHLDSPSGIVDMQGSVGLDGTLDYQGQVVLTPSAVAGGGDAGNVIGGVLGGLLGSRVGKITAPFALGGTIQEPKVRPGKGLPTFERPSSTTAPSTTQPSQPAAPANPVDALRDLFKKR